jgi:hypothetical protein
VELQHLSTFRYIHILVDPEANEFSFKKKKNSSLAVQSLVLTSSRSPVRNSCRHTPASENL